MRKINSCHARQLEHIIHLQRFPSLLVQYSAQSPAAVLVPVLDLTHDTVCVAPSLNFPPTIKNHTDSPLHRDLVTASPEERERAERRRGWKRNPTPPKSTPGWVCFSTEDSSQQLSGSILLLIFGRPHITCSQIQLDRKECEPPTGRLSSVSTIDLLFQDQRTSLSLPLMLFFVIFMNHNLCPLSANVPGWIIDIRICVVACWSEHVCIHVLWLSGVHRLF